MAYLIPENLRSRRDLAPAVGHLARLLGEALDDSATVWFEPLFDVEGDRPDLIVLIPDTGVLVIEIIQQKASALVDITDGRLAVTVDGTMTPLDDPFSRAQRFGRDLVARAGAAGIGPPDELPVMAMGVFAYIDRETARARGVLAVVDPDRCLFRDDLDRMNADMMQARHAIAAAMAAPLREVISDDAERLYRAVIHPDTVLRPVQMSLPVIHVSLGPDVHALDREQESLAKTLSGGHRVIRGVAGSGKTVVLVHRARLLAQLNHKDRILVACYNRALQGWLERQLKPYSNVRVRTLPGVMNDILDLRGAPHGNYDSEDLEDVAVRALHVLDEIGDGARSKRYDHVLIDEGQDFGTESLRFATKLLRNGSDSLLVVADAAQSIYRSGFSWKKAGIQASGRTKVLRRNYRNTREILDYAWLFLSRGLAAESGADDDGDVAVPPEAGLRRGPLPLFRHLGSPDEEVLDIAHEVSTWIAAGESPGDIAVLYGGRFTGGFQWVERLRLALDRAGVPWYWPIDPTNQSKHLVGSRDDAVLICTMHSAKGLEFKNVILCGYLDDRPPEEAEKNRRLVYVGMTRAKERLVLTASGHHPYIADLEQGPTGR